MTNISKRKLNKDFEQELFTQFATLFSSPNKKRNVELFSAILTETERIMLIKRLAVIVFLTKHISMYRIAKTLHMSESSIRDIKHKCDAGTFDSITRSIQGKSFDAKKFWKTIEFILSAGLPPRGRGRWKWLYEMTDDIQPR